MKLSTDSGVIQSDLNTATVAVQTKLSSRGREAVKRNRAAYMDGRFIWRSIRRGKDAKSNPLWPDNRPTWPLIRVPLEAASRSAGRLDPDGSRHRPERDCELCGFAAASLSASMLGPHKPGGRGRGDGRTTRGMYDLYELFTPFDYEKKEKGEVK